MNQNSPQSAASVQQLEAYFASLPDAIIVWDRTGKILFVNAAALTLFEVQDTVSWFGTSAQQFLQCYKWYDEQQRSFFFAPWLLDLTACTQEPASFPYEQTLLLALPSHRQVFLELHCSLMRDGKPQPMGMLADFHEVAPRYQKALHTQRVYEAVMALDDAIAQLSEQFPVEVPEETFLLSPPVLFVGQQLVDVIHQVLACWCVSLIGFHTPDSHMAYVVGSGFTAEREHFFRATSWRFRFTDFFDETAFARLQANQEVIFPPGCARVPVGFPQEFATANMLAVPLFWEQHLTGLLLIYKHEEEEGYTQEEIDLVRAVAEHVLLLVGCLGSLQADLGKQGRELVLSEVDRLSNHFLTLASHDLRTPLTAIKGNLQLGQRRLERLKSELAQESERIHAQVARIWESLEAAEQSVQLQERMVQDMIDDVRAQTGQLDLELVPCDLLLLVKQAVEKQQKSEPGRAIKLEILTAEPTIAVLADAGRIIQVLTIYLAAASASSPVEQPVTVLVQAEEQAARVSVRSPGAGISPEEQLRLWDRFYRGKGSSIQHELDLSGGLRFYLCRVIIERHHGHVGLESVPGQETTFWFTLPLLKK